MLSMGSRCLFIPDIHHGCVVFARVPGGGLHAKTSAAAGAAAAVATVSLQSVGDAEIGEARQTLEYDGESLRLAKSQHHRLHLSLARIGSSITIGMNGVLIDSGARERGQRQRHEGNADQHEDDEAT